MVDNKDVLKILEFMSEHDEEGMQLAEMLYDEANEERGFMGNIDEDLFREILQLFLKSRLTKLM